MAERGVKFHFKESATILKATGRSARNLRELRSEIARAPERSIFHHTYEYFINDLVLQYTNDFARWAGEFLEERALAEQLSSIDPYEFDELEGLRGAIQGAIDRYLEEFPEPREVIPGNEFHFNENVVLVFPVGVRAENLAEFLIAVRYVDPASIYYHFYDARTRLGGERNDFSAWFDEALGKRELAERVALIDPFVHNLERIRGLILREVEEEVRRDMEGQP